MIIVVEKDRNIVIRNCVAVRSGCNVTSMERRFSPLRLCGYFMYLYD
jgi:hypothetical protein